MSEDARRKQIEDRIFRLLGTGLTSPEIATAVGLDPDDALPIILKVIDERGTPALASARRAIERLGAIRVI